MPLPTYKDHGMAVNPLNLMWVSLEPTIFIWNIWQNGGCLTEYSDTCSHPMQYGVVRLTSLIYISNKWTSTWINCVKSLRTQLKSLLSKLQYSFPTFFFFSKKPVTSYILMVLKSQLGFLLLPLLGTCSMLVSCLAYSSTLKIRGDIPPKHLLTFNGLHGVISQNIVLFITTAVRTSNPTYQSLYSFNMNQNCNRSNTLNADSQFQMLLKTEHVDRQTWRPVHWIIWCMFCNGLNSKKQ
jgi:hypothetical protein